MAKTREQKEAEVRIMIDSLKTAKSIVLADLSPLKVSESTILRHKALESDVKVMGAKKTLFKKAIKELNIDINEDSLGGSVMMLVANGDELAPAKLVSDLRKDHKDLIIQGGVLESKWVSADEVLALAKLPSKEELIAQVVGTIRAPLSGLVGVLQGNLRNLVYALNAIKDAKS
jgi:large subunit ribosomal protein L10